jgi:hypothetical protein
MPIPEALIRRGSKAQAAIAELAGSTAAKALPDLSKIARYEAGGVLRTIATGTVSAFGQASTATGVQTYGEFQNWAASSGLLKTKYAPSTLSGFGKSVPEIVDPLVGRSMAAHSQGLFAEAATFLVAGISREVTNLYRQTIGENSSRDPNVTWYQRIASADACAFCAYIAAVTENTQWADDDGYHDHCGCTTAPVFEKDGGFRPDFYDTIDSDIANAKSEITDLYNAERPAWQAQWQASGGRMGKNLKRDFLKAFPEAATNTENILARIRANTGRA